MVSHLFFYQMMFLGLLWLCVMLHYAWPNECTGGDQRPSKPLPPPRKHSSDPKPFPGLTRKPPCAACEQARADALQPPGCPPPRMVPARGRPRQVDTSSHFCPQPPCAYWGWLGLGNITSNGHPSGGLWRQLHCTNCGGYFQETHGTPLHGKRVSPDMLVWAIGALAEGLGIRAVARVFEVDPHTVLAWLVEVADHATAFSQYFLHDVRVTQVQLDELFALLSAVKTGEVSEAEAVERLSRSPHWVWAAIDPVTKLLLTVDVGDRTLAMAQRVVHQVVQVLAPDCVPLFLTDGFKEYATALLTHDGQWVQPARQRAQGPTPRPRWMPLPGLLYAQVVKTVRRRRLVRVKHRVVFGTLEAINDALCKGEDGLRQQLALYHVYYNFCLPHVSVRQPLPQPLSTNGTGSAKMWQPQTPAMAAGLTDHVWTLREVLRFRVPPWPQPVGV